MKKQITLHLDEDLLHSLNEEAALNGVSRSMIVNNHLRTTYQTLEALTRHEFVKKQDIYQELQEETLRRKLLTLHYVFKSLNDLTEMNELRKVLSK